MRKLLFVSILAILTFGLGAQNIGIDGTQLHLPSNTTVVGEAIAVNTSINVTNDNGPISCLFSFNYLIDGLPPLNATVPVFETIFLPSNSSTTLGPAGDTELLLLTEGVSNITVQVSATNCTDTNGGIGSLAEENILVIAGAPIPTLGQWGMIVLGLIVLIVGVVNTQSERQLNEQIR